VLSEESVHLREIKKNSYLKLPAGIHRFPFAFIVPNVNKRQKKRGFFVQPIFMSSLTSLILLFRIL
jgi:hypothetical protein